MPDQPISELAYVLMERELAKDPNQFKQKPLPTGDSGGMSPQTLATLGGLVDAASTYTFLKRGTHNEGNPMINMISGGSPEMGGLAALGGLAASKGVTHLIGKKWPRVADAIAANLGALQLGYGTHNFAKTFNRQAGDPNKSSADEWSDVLVRNLNQGSSVK